MTNVYSNTNSKKSRRPDGKNVKFVKAKPINK